MSKETLRKRSSSLKKRTRSLSGKRSVSSSFKDEEDVARDESVLIPVVIEKPKRNYQDELVFGLFNSMLDVIVEDWKTVTEKLPNICSCKEKSDKFYGKDFKELSADDFQSLDITKLNGSKISLKEKVFSKTKRESLSKQKSRTSQQSKESERSKLSLKKSSKDASLKSVSKKSHGSGSSEASSQSHSLDWILQPPDENVVIKFKNGNRYEGPVSKKVMHGFGKFFWADGAVYEGDFVNGNATGHGTLQYPDLTLYHGGFCKNLLHGEGVINISSSTMIYSGSWKAGKKHGKGWLLYEPGNWYDGEWFEDQRQGNGTRYYKTGEKYKGKWHQGKQHGDGTFIWANNDIYKGEWKNGLMHGYGEYTWNSFLNETFSFPVENSYLGNWHEGLRNGVGVMNFGTESGARLAGFWENNQKHGPGVLVCGNGKVIQSNPLFWNDKPIHLDIEADPGYPKMTHWDEKKLSTISTQNMKSEENKSTLHLTHPTQSKSEEKLRRSLTIQDIHKNQEALKSIEDNFLLGKVQCSPISTPLHLPPEQTDFSYFINLAVEKYTKRLYRLEIFENVEPDGKAHSENVSTQSIIKYSKWKFLYERSEEKHSSNVSMEHPKSTSSEIECRITNFQIHQQEIEETNLRDSIITHLSNLYKIYAKYASIATSQVLRFKSIMIRYFLWQMFRDKNIVNAKYNLVELDLILIQNPASGFEDDHDPFEKIYFWQFLQILVTLSWTLHKETDVTNSCKQSGVLSTLFVDFLTNVLYNNPGITFSASLFEYRDLLPINGVYQLYQTLPQPFTARRFLNRVCVKKKNEPPFYLKTAEDTNASNLIRGRNVAPMGGRITFFPVDAPDFGEKPFDPYPDPPSEDPFRNDLYVLRSLGPKKVVECLAMVCPHIMEEGVIVNMEYPLSFIDFYDVFLMCGFMVVDKVKRREAGLRLLEERRLEMERAELKLANSVLSIGKHRPSKERRSSRK